LSREKILNIINGLDFKVKGSTPRLLLDEEALVVASSEMKCIASQPERTKYMAVNLHNLLRILDNDFVLFKFP